MDKPLLLWVDDEIELLRSHLQFLEKKGYQVITATNGRDAIDLCHKHNFDLVFLDEMMPGLSGLETLQHIKGISASLPVVMVTKSEEEDIMNRAIGAKIADYLIKPINPNQVLLTLKKNIHRREIESLVAQDNYRNDYMDISSLIPACHTFEDFIKLYRRLVSWEIELGSTDSEMLSVLTMQKEEANGAFAKFIKTNYLAWIDALSPTSPVTDHPILSPEIFKKKVFPLIDKGDKVWFILLDNFRFDQWRSIIPSLKDDFDIAENVCCSILPTATQYARNAIFSGLMPLDISKIYPHLWVEEESSEGKNLNEEALIREQIKRFRRNFTFSYNKINSLSSAEKYLHKYSDIKRNALNVVVFNFIDSLSHAGTESKMIRELVNSDQAFRSLTQSWFRHSPISSLFKLLSDSDYTIILTTDHGSLRTSTPVEVVGDRHTNPNLRYKLGKNLNFSSRSIFEIKDPTRAGLPAPNLTTTYIFATGDTFFAYPNNYNRYVSLFKDTFQHGGISLEEMLIPLITIKSKHYRAT